MQLLCAERGFHLQGPLLTLVAAWGGCGAGTTYYPRTTQKSSNSPLGALPTTHPRTPSCTSGEGLPRLGHLSLRAHWAYHRYGRSGGSHESLEMAVPGLCFSYTC